MTVNYCRQCVKTKVTLDKYNSCQIIKQTQMDYDDHQLNDSSCYFSDEDDEVKQEIFIRPAKQDHSNEMIIQNQVEDQKSIKARQEKQAMLAIEESNINSLKGVDIFQIFYEQQNYSKLAQRCRDYPVALKKFNWKLHYIIGELIVHAQEYLIKQSLLPQSLKLAIEDIQSITNQIITKAMMQTSNQDQDFIMMKKNMQLVYRLDACDLEIARDLYNYCIRILRSPLQFEMQIDKNNKNNNQQEHQIVKKRGRRPSQLLPLPETESKSVQNDSNQQQMKQSHKTHHPTPKIGPYSVVRMENNKYFPNKKYRQDIRFTSQINTKSNQQQNPKEPSASNDFKVMVSKKNIASNRVDFPLQNPIVRISSSVLSNQQTVPQGQAKINGSDKDEDNLINLKTYSLTTSQQKIIDDQKKNSPNNPSDTNFKTRASNNYPRKWQPSEQSTFCKLYSETTTSLACLKAMEQKLGPDTRWRDEYSIEAKIKYLVQKVFNKFANLRTSNQNISIFKTNKLDVLSCNNIELRHRIFRHLAVIYDAMLSASDSKKEIISRRIIEINRLCKEIQV